MAYNFIPSISGTLGDTGVYYQHITSVDINNTSYKIFYSHSFRITCDMFAVSLLESRE